MSGKEGEGLSHVERGEEHTVYLNLSGQLDDVPDRVQCSNGCYSTLTFVCSRCSQMAKQIPTPSSLLVPAPTPTAIHSGVFHVVCSDTHMHILYVRSTQVRTYIQMPPASSQLTLVVLLSIGE